MREHYSIITNNWEYCYAMLDGCTGKATDCHHLISGSASRKKSDKLGLVIPICRNCHNKIHNDPEVMRKFRKLGQKAFEFERPLKEWMDIFHRDYLWEERSNGKQG